MMTNGRWMQVINTQVIDGFCGCPPGEMRTIYTYWLPDDAVPMIHDANTNIIAGSYTPLES